MFCHCQSRCIAFYPPSLVLTSQLTFTGDTNLGNVQSTPLILWYIENPTRSSSSIEFVALEQHSSFNIVLMAPRSSFLVLLSLSFHLLAARLRTCMKDEKELKTSKHLNTLSCFGQQKHIIFPCIKYYLRFNEIPHTWPGSWFVSLRLRSILKKLMKQLQRGIHAFGIHLLT